MNYILSTLILLPLVGVYFVTTIDDSDLFKDQKIRYIGLYTTLFTFFISLFLWILFDNSTSQFQFVEKYYWNPISNGTFYLGIDGISLFLVILTTFLIPVCLLASWNAIKINVKEYVIAFLFLESILIIVFTVLDLLIFYIFFESVLIPMFAIIGIWGSRERKVRASYLFFLYTLFGSVLMLLGILLIYCQVGSTDFLTLYNTKFETYTQIILWFAFFASFASKIPMVPVHIWLPEAHVEAPTAGSVVLAGILLKLGGYGFLRFSLPMFPEATLFFTPLIYTLSAIAVIYASLTTLRQIDLKRIIAYSSVAHMNFVTIGMFTLTLQGLEGSIVLMLSHGLVSSALFLGVGVLYDRYHTRLLAYYSGFAQVMPLFCLIFGFFSFANISIPGTSSFVGEFLVLISIWESNFFITLLVTTGVIFGALYALWLFNRIAFGNLKVFHLINYFTSPSDQFTYSKNYDNSISLTKHNNVTKVSILHNDMDRREMAVFIPFIIMTLVMGIYPEIFMVSIHISTVALLEAIVF